MKLYYRHVPRGNFGDDLNPWLWSKLLPGYFDEDNSVLFVGIGSIINRQVPEKPFKVVMGSGVGYGKPPSISEKKWRIYCVRGPLSAKALGLQKEFGIGDCAILVRSIQLPNLNKVHRVSYMPHQTSAALGDWEKVCKEVGINFIHPGWDVETVLLNILKTELLITEAMHGAVVADAMRIPWIPVRAYYGVPKFKWNDWCQSLGLEYRPSNLPCLLRQDKLATVLRNRFIEKRNRLKSIIRPSLAVLTFLGRTFSKITEQRREMLAARLLSRIMGSQPVLSDDNVIASVTDQLLEKLEMFKMDFDLGRFKMRKR